MADTIVIRDKYGNIKASGTTGNLKTSSGERYNARDRFNESTVRAMRGGKTIQEIKDQRTSGSQHIIIDDTGNRTVKTEKTATSSHAIQRTTTKGIRINQDRYRQKQATARYVGATKGEEKTITPQEQRGQARQDLKYAKSRADKYRNMGDHKKAHEIITKEYMPAMNELFVSSFPTASEVKERGNKIISPVVSGTDNLVNKLGLTGGRKETVTLEIKTTPGKTEKTIIETRKEYPNMFEKMGITQTKEQKENTYMSSQFGKGVARTVLEIPKTSLQLGVAGGTLFTDVINEPKKYTPEYVGAGVGLMATGVKKGIEENPGAFLGSVAAWGVADKGIKTVIHIPKTIQKKAIDGAIINKHGHTMTIGAENIAKETPQIIKKTYQTSTSKGNVFIEKIGTKTIKDPLKLADGTILPKGKYDIFNVAGGYISKRGKAVVKTKGGYVAFINKNKNVFVSHTKGNAITDVEMFAGRKATFKAVGGVDDFKLKVLKNEKIYSFNRHETLINDLGVSKQQQQNIARVFETKSGAISGLKLQKGDSVGLRYNLNQAPLKNNILDRGGVAAAKKTGIKIKDLQKENWDVYFSKSKSSVGAKAKTGIFVKQAAKETKDVAGGSSLKTIEKLDKKSLSSLIEPLEKAHIKIAHTVPRVVSKTKNEILTPIKESISSGISGAIGVKEKTITKTAIMLSAPFSYKQAQETITKEATMTKVRGRVKQKNKPAFMQFVSPATAITVKQTQRQNIKLLQGQMQGQKQAIRPIQEIAPSMPAPITPPAKRTGVKFNPIKPPIMETGFKKPPFGFGSDRDTGPKRKKISVGSPTVKRKKDINPLYGWGAVARFESMFGRKAIHPKKTEKEKSKFKKHLRRSGLVLDYKMPGLKSLSKKKRFSL